MRWLLLLLLLVPRGARAAGGDADRPWALGVSEERRSGALALLSAGNQAFAHAEYADAAKDYRAALAQWDHPAIHGNLAIALIHLDELVSAFEHVEMALKYGDAPFEETVYSQLLTHRKLLVGQLGFVEVKCEVPGAVVTLDAETLLVGRGNATRYVRAGAHQVIARKPNHLTFANQVTVLPQQPVVINVVLVPLAEAGGVERRWSVWKPWLVFGAGAAASIVGLGLVLAGRNEISEYEQEIARSCPTGCDPSTLPHAVRAQVPRGQYENGFGIGTLAAGGATMVVGAVLAALNRPQRVHVDESGRRVAWNPYITPSGGGLILSFAR